MEYVTPTMASLGTSPTSVWLWLWVAVAAAVVLVVVAIKATVNL